MQYITLKNGHSNRNVSLINIEWDDNDDLTTSTNVRWSQINGHYVV